MRARRRSAEVRIHAERERPHSATAAPIDGSSHVSLRPIRLLILLLVLALTLALALLRPLPGRATAAAKRHRAHHAKHVRRHEPRRRHRTALRTTVTTTTTTSRGRSAPASSRTHATSSAIPYRWGGSSPHSGFDCSGLVRFVYSHFGIALPHSTWGDLSHGRRVSRGLLARGRPRLLLRGEPRRHLRRRRPLHRRAAHRNTRPASRRWTATRPITAPDASANAAGT